MHISTHARRNSQVGSIVPRAQSCTSPITAPTWLKHRRVHTKSESRYENPNLRASCQLCKTTFVAIINFHKVASTGFFFSFSPPPSQSALYHEFDFSVQSTQLRCSASAKVRGTLPTYGSQGFFVVVVNAKFVGRENISYQTH